jgi:heat shock protein HslJ
MKTRTGLSIVLLALAVLLAGCGSGGSSALRGTEWVLVLLAGQAPLAGTTTSVEFAGDQVSGSAGCNTYFGTWQASSSELTISDLANTEMWCADPEGVMDQEQAFLATLRSVAGYRLAGERLEMLDAADGVILTFDPRP